jgi:hypothetical protein
MRLSYLVLCSTVIRVVFMHSYKRSSLVADSNRIPTTVLRNTAVVSAQPGWSNNTRYVFPVGITRSNESDYPSMPYTHASSMPYHTNTSPTARNAHSAEANHGATISQDCPQHCGRAAGASSWTFGTGELIGLAQTLSGLVQAILQVLTLPTIALHFMMHGRRHP